MTKKNGKTDRTGHWQMADAIGGIGHRPSAF